MPRAIVLAALLAAQAGPSLANDLQVSPQGLLYPADREALVSPLGDYRGRVTVLAGDFVALEARVAVETQVGGAWSRHVLPRVAGGAFLLSDVGRLVAIESYHSHAVPTKVAIYDLDGTSVLDLLVPALIDPALSADGKHLGFRSRRGLEVIDLAALTRQVYPSLDRFDVTAGGGVVGVVFGEPDRLVAIAPSGERGEVTLPERPRAIKASPDGRGVLVMTRDELLEVSAAATTRVLFRADGGELRDLRVARDEVMIGERRFANGLMEGRMYTFGASSPRPELRATSSTIPAASLPFGFEGLPWPLQPVIGQQSIGNTYGEFQDYGGSPYLHPGIDVLGANHQPVYAVKSGVVKAVLTTSAQWHWRIAIADEGGAGPSDGYLYAHVDLPTITVNVGDTVVAGQHIGDLVTWPVTGFTHTHFARIRDSGVQWSGNWANTDNPHIDMKGQTESTAPVFQNAIGQDRFAFCRDETSNYQSPNALNGKIDIVVRVGDTVASAWLCSVQRLVYSIYPVGSPQQPVVDNRLAVEFDMPLDTYQNGPIDPFVLGLLYKRDTTCFTQADYNNRDFYHVITNSNGDLVYDAADALESWDTTTVPNGNYVIEVTAFDAAGNSATQSMTVTVNNGP